VRWIALFSVVGLLRLAYFHFRVEPRDFPVARHIDERYAALEAAVPASGEVGYVSDAPPPANQTDDPTVPGTRLFEETQYALAPLILRNGDDTQPIVIAVLLVPANLEAVARQHHLRVLRQPAPGFAVLGK
jgi:hypothetical protein